MSKQVLAISLFIALFNNHLDMINGLTLAMASAEPIIGHREPWFEYFLRYQKGKIESPYTFIREGFWRGYGYFCLNTANRDLMACLTKKEQRVQGFV